MIEKANDFIQLEKEMVLLKCYITCVFYGIKFFGRCIIKRFPPKIRKSHQIPLHFLSSPSCFLDHFPTFDQTDQSKFFGTLK